MANVTINTEDSTVTLSSNNNVTINVAGCCSGNNTGGEVYEPTIVDLQIQTAQQTEPYHHVFVGVGLRPVQFFQMDYSNGRWKNKTPQSVGMADDVMWFSNHYEFSVDATTGDMYVRFFEAGQWRISY